VRIVFDVSPLTHTRTGIGNYTRGALAGLVQASAGEVDVVAFALASRRGAAMIRNSLDGMRVDIRIRTLPLAHAWRTLWSAAGAPALERLLGRFDVLHLSDWMQLPQRSGVRAATIHDLAPLAHPEWTSRGTRALHRRSFRHVAQTCDVVFAVSDYTARQATERLGIDSARIRISHPAVGESFRPDGPREDLGRPYLLSVATLEPRKNLHTLLEAHALLEDPPALAVVGARGWGEQPLLDRPGVIPLGYVPDERLPALYRGASAFVQPSWLEGFGMPVVEAMASGVPCVVSSSASLDTVAGDAAVRVDPASPEAIAAGIERAVAEREELVRRGFEHARRFTWRATGEALLAGYREAA
jgi:glycosyltransferase involved in cell wall biosynthesis